MNLPTALDADLLVILLPGDRDPFFHLAFLGDEHQMSPLHQCPATAPTILSDWRTPPEVLQWACRRSIRMSWRDSGQLKENGTHI
jgi:hypothetical protein